MGILNRTPDSFYDHGSYWDFEAFLRVADRLVTEGADVLDVGGVKAGPGPEISEQEELERVVPAVEALAGRFDLPVSADTWRASVAEAAFAAGAVVDDIADSPTLATSRSAPARVQQWSPPTSASLLGYRIPSPRTTTWSGR